MDVSHRYNQPTASFADWARDEGSCRPIRALRARLFLPGSAPPRDHQRAIAPGEREGDCPSRPSRSALRDSPSTAPVSFLHRLPPLALLTLLGSAASPSRRAEV